MNWFVEGNAHQTQGSPSRVLFEHDHAQSLLLGDDEVMGYLSNKGRLADPRASRNGDEFPLAESLGLLVKASKRVWDTGCGVFLDHLLPQVLA